ncbi:PglL family O-oligosaccharyltransferase [Acinetobacter calcoaceticus]|uniref:PglL family O-oligosaccharyltransferase n=1 Tax=Acinetobacter calcoaceticus TaxID=471 RepID=UPI001E28A3BA|nr:O-antigen ligase family protein [Acinetobacter calcoaceticus]UGQ30188.1 pilin glycosylation ligase domain-containing protein [Acinetobacter calcoaceticus]
MLIRLFCIMSFFLFLLSVLNPIHTLPWGSFFSEFLAFVAGWLLLPSLFCKDVKININTLPFLIICFVPLVQYYLGQIFFFSNSLFSSIGLFYFWMMMVVGSNLKINKNLDIVFFLSILFVSVSFLSSFISILQWLNISGNSLFIMSLIGNRPYANMAQPNHLATFLCMGIFSCWYLFETKKIPCFMFFLLFFIFSISIALTQSRTAWLILLLSFIFMLVSIKKYKLRLSYVQLSFSGLFFIFCNLGLYYLDKVLQPYFNVVKTNSVIERASEGYGRLKIWNQMVHAIVDEPWFGYGWNQTTAAQFRVIDKVPSQEWVTSAHNLMLDIIIWCGVPLGGIILIYLFYFYIKILINIFDFEGVFCFLIISSVLIHSFLEFPIYYSYFFIPVGLLIGSQLKYETINTIRVNYRMVVFLFFVIIFGGIGIFKEYLKINDNIFAGKLHAMGNLRSEVILPYKLVFFDFFDSRSKWIALYPKMKVDKEKLFLGREMVQVYLKPYDIQKYALLLAYNGYELEAKRQLKILEVLYGQKVSYQSLFEAEMINKVSHDHDE